MVPGFKSKANPRIHFTEEWQVQNLSDRQGDLGLPKVLAASGTEGDAIEKMKQLAVRLENGWQLAIVRVYNVSVA